MNKKEIVKTFNNAWNKIFANKNSHRKLVTSYIEETNPYEIKLREENIKKLKYKHELEDLRNLVSIYCKDLCHLIKRTTYYDCRELNKCLAAEIKIRIDKILNNIID